ncbi:hypothetical protein C5167_037711 [Papaver somniferum]|uniref:Uncharacterized protein n=1 Tax=Papaver somniferum TaxID=3469 RepID=A0A4Y7IAC3_PAPSO|nr:hypothetical protein C5167_037711 [Papaver somniferum]
MANRKCSSLANFGNVFHIPSLTTSFLLLLLGRQPHKDAIFPWFGSPNSKSHGNMIRVTCQGDLIVTITKFKIVVFIRVPFSRVTFSRMLVRSYN